MCLHALRSFFRDHRALSFWQPAVSRCVLLVMLSASWHPGWLRAQTANMSAQVTVDTTQITRTIPDTLYGTNFEYPFEAMGLWNTALNGFDYGVWSSSFAVKPTLWRFPGGVYSDSYNWTNGVGPQAARPSTPIWQGGVLDNNNVGTDEALAFMATIGSHLMITVNAGSGTSDQAASWVQYTNSLKQNVKYWEVGNELYYNPPVSPIPYYTMTPSTYASTFVQFSTAMKQVDPTIKMLAIGGNILNQSYTNWDQTVLNQAGPYMDYLAVHNSYAPVNVFDSGDDVRTVYSALLAAPLSIAQNLQSLSNEIDMYAGANASQIRLAVTEWGPLFDLYPSPYILHVRTLGSALFVASTLKAYIEAPRMDIANFFTMVDNGVSAWLGKRGNAYYPEAPYYAFEMYTRHFGSLLVSSTVTSPTYNSPAVGVVAAQSNVPYLEVVSSLSANQKKLYVLGINKNFDSPITATIQLNGFTPAADGSAWVLVGTSIDANTGNDLPAGTWPPQMQDPYTPRFNLGSPNEVQLIHLPQTTFGQTFTFTFPQHSVTSLELHVAKQPPGTRAPRHK